MAYRYTNTDKWSDAWFSELRPIEKLLFNYLCDNCDIAGFIEITIKKWAIEIGTDKPQIEGALKGLARGLIFSKTGDCLYIRNFLKHQKNLPINTNNKAHLGIIYRFDAYLYKFGFTDYNEFIEGACKGLLSPSGIGIGIGIDLGNEDIPITNKEQEVYSFEDFWNDYDKKVGDKIKLSKKWDKVKKEDRMLIKEYLPKYKINQPDKQYRKNPETFLNNESWRDELVKSFEKFDSKETERQVYFKSKYSGEGMEIKGTLTRYQNEIRNFGQDNVTFLRYAD